MGAGAAGTAGTAVVVGAGVGGLATAIGLRRAGWEVTVLERRAAPERYGTAFAVHPTAQAALDRLGRGLGEALRERAVPYRDARIRRPDGRVLAALPLERIERKAGRPELLISRPYLIDALLAALDRLGGTRIAYGQAYEAGDAWGADLLVGADGINSAVRAARFGRGSGPRELGTDAWIGIADFETGVHGETWGDGRFFGMTPVEPGRTNWYAALPGAATAEDVRAAFAGWHDPIPRVLADTDPRTWIRYPVRHLHPALPAFTRTDGYGPGGARGPGGAGDPACPVALVGDAAHAMTPNLGQGACTAILDAEALTRAVTARGTAGLPAALRAYEGERRRSAQRVAFGSRTLHRFVTLRRPALRDALVGLLPGGGGPATSM
ncbi:FAD-dependent oxidoreductase [Streptomyces sp. NBC_00454]|uniref:FAD-dependent oxidoreductase n=1 Tax=Streptomyces sp. NBC_00454 TaxID=2975747 RepID=UPI0030E16BCC